MKLSPMLLIPLRMSLAGLLAMVAMISFHLTFGYWAVVTVAAITAADENGTLFKGLMRIVGTIFGAIIGYFLIQHVSHPFNVIAFFLGIFVFSLLSLQKNSFNYAGLIAGVTMVIVIGAGQAAAIYRTLDVIMGVIIMSVLTLLIHQNKIIFLKNIELKNFKINLQRIKAASLIAFTATFTYLIWLIWDIPQGFWIPVSCLFIMEENVNTTQKKGFLRFFAHLGAASLGLLAAIFYQDNVLLVAITLVVGFFVCGVLIAKKQWYSTIGNTMGIALAIMLLSGFNTHNSLNMVVARFVNVSIGIAIGLFMAQNFLKQTE